ncbi:AfsR/SARP family transcriptional regulator [Streptomyces sp. OfavH-34-F]|uniref:AfsR/SARP family transcriptional regulator n=1 Tax=Streptomyces sp. OfavH-34-F TaxID=2917760 RepID=UPI001EF2DCBE|nr:AfsR/SARP family transcriptional regulator [Streptomyces sp. OfavH-34-F]MCG7525417.1 AfsR/SARP family transcriptional regulator [Streptomyces sp. OfavH-34-F]
MALLLEANRTVSLDRIADALWDGEPPRSAVANIRTHVSALRRHTDGAASLLSRPGGYELLVPEEHCDHHRFMRLAAQGRRALDDGNPEQAAPLLGQALALWTTGVAAEGVPRHGWPAGPLDHLDEERRRVIEDLAESCVEAGEPRSALRELHALLAADPLRDRGWALRMRAHHSLGEPGGVSDSYQAAVRAFRDQLGARPGIELDRLHRALNAS